MFARFVPHQTADAVVSPNSKFPAVKEKQARNLCCQNFPASSQKYKHCPVAVILRQGRISPRYHPAFYGKRISSLLHINSSLHVTCANVSLYTKNLQSCSSREKFIYYGNAQDAYSRGHPLSSSNHSKLLNTIITFLKSKFYHISLKYATIFSKCIPWEAFTKMASCSFSRSGNFAFASSSVANQITLAEGSTSVIPARYCFASVPMHMI